MDSLAPLKPKSSQKQVQYIDQIALFIPLGLLVMACLFVLAIYETLTFSRPPFDLLAYGLGAALLGQGLVLYRIRYAHLYVYAYGIALGLFVLSAVNFQLGPWPHEAWRDAALFMLIGFLFVGLGSWHQRHDNPQQWAQNPEARSIMLRPLPLLAGVLMMAVVAEASAQNFGLLGLKLADSAQLLLFVGGCVAISLALLGHSEPRPEAQANDAHPYPVWGLLLLICTIALLLRVWQLETGIHQFVDEMNFGRAAWGILQPGAEPVALLAPFSNVAAFPWVYPYWQSLGIELFGFNLTALRIVSVTFGVLTVPALYLLARELFNTHIGLIAALLLATFPPHIHFSRLGINNIADPFFGVMMLVFLARAFRYQRQRDFVFAGIMMACTQFFYEGGRVVFPLLGVAWLIALVFLRRLPVMKVTSRYVLLLLFTAILVAAPLYYTLMMRQLPLLSRFETAGVGGSYWHVLTDYDREQTLEEHITRPLLIYVRNPDLSEFYGGEQPLVLVFAVPLLFFGVSLVLWRVRYAPHLMLVLWLGLVSGGGMLLAESGHAARFVVVFPALCILIAIAIWHLSLRRSFLAVLIVVLLAVLQANYYFAEHLPVYNSQRRQNLDYQDAVFRAAQLPPYSMACFVTELPLDTIMVTNMRDYLAPDLNICQLRPEDLNDGTFENLAPAAQKVFFIEPHDRQTADLLFGYYGEGVQGPLMSPYETVPLHTQYLMYIVD